MVGIIDRIDTMEIGLPRTDRDKLLDDTHEDNHDHNDEEEGDIHHHDNHTMMSSRCTKSFHTIHVDQIGKVWEATLIVALINSTHTVMVILLLKLSL
jgi:hypothetical protein